VVEALLDWVNPVAPFVAAFRSIPYYGSAPDLGRIAYAHAAAALALLAGNAVFRRMEGGLAVVI